MPARHLDLPTLERFAASSLDRSQMIEAGRHLFACARCRTRLGQEVSGGAEILRRLCSKWPGAGTEQYEGIFERIQIQAAQRMCTARQEQALAAVLADELDSLPPEVHAERLETDERLQNAVLVDVLLERSRNLWGDDVERAERLARLGLAIANHLDTTRYGHGLVCDLKARGWAFIGNALRLRSDLSEAESALAQAESLLKEGSCEPLERALFLELKASLLRAQRCLGEALETIREACSIYRRVRDPHQEGRALVIEAMILAYAGAQERSIATSFHALERLDSTRDPRLVFAVRHNLVADLVECGRAGEALAMLPEVRREVAEVGHRTDRVRVTWLEALVEMELGQHSDAEEKLYRVRADYEERGDGLQTALVSLDLARLFLEQGRMAETRRLAAEMRSIFMAKNIRRESLAALLVFQRAAEQEAATVLMVKEIAQRIKQVQHNSPDDSERPA